MFPSQYSTSLKNIKSQLNGEDSGVCAEYSTSLKNIKSQLRLPFGQATGKI